MKYGYACYAPVTCETFIGGPGASYNLTGLDFRISFESNEEKYLRVPLTSLMRNSLAVTPQCEILVYYLDTRYDMSYNIVLGSAFLNSFYA